MEDYIKRLFKVYSLVVLLIIVGCSVVFIKTKSPYVWIFAALSILGIVLNMWMIYKANKKK